MAPQSHAQSHVCPMCRPTKVQRANDSWYHWLRTPQNQYDCFVSRSHGWHEDTLKSRQSFTVVLILYHHLYPTRRWSRYWARSWRQSMSLLWLHVRPITQGNR